MENETIFKMKRNNTRIDILMAIQEIKNDTALAEKLGITPQALYSKLSGNITMNTIEQLSNVFNVSVKEMFKD